MQDHDISTLSSLASLRDELARNGTAIVRMSGNSMWPLYPDGREVTVCAPGGEAVRVGDVVVVRLPDHTACHRVFRTGRGWIQTKADDSWALDPWVRPDAVIARAEGVEFGYLISRLSLMSSRVYPLTGAAGKMLLRSRFGDMIRRSVSCAREVREVNRAILALLRGEACRNQRGREGITSPRFLQRVFAEGVSGLIFHRLNSGDIIPHSRGHEGIMSPEVYDELRRDYMRTIGRNMLLKEKLLEIVRALQRVKLKAVLLRGRNLMGGMYPSLGVKASADIDILISGRDLARVRTVLGGMGYASAEPYPYLFWKDDVPVDLHLDSACFWKNGSYRFPIDMRRRDVWTNGEAVSDEFPDVRFLSVNDEVLLCCVHAQEHGFNRLITMIDAAALVSAEGGFDWDGFVARARTLGLERPAYFTMRFLSRKRLLDVPDQALSGLAGARLGLFERWCLTRLLDDARPAVSGGLLYLLSIPSPGDRLRFLKGAVFPAHRTGPGSTLLRPFRLAAAAARELFA